MTNKQEILARTRNKLDGMTEEEKRELSLRIDAANIRYEEEKKLIDEINKLECIFIHEIRYQTIKQKFLAEIIAILGYNTYTIVRPNEDEQVKKQENIERNAKVIGCIYPQVSFLKMLNLFETIEAKEKIVKIIEELINKYKKEYECELIRKR